MANDSNNNGKFSGTTPTGSGFGGGGSAGGSGPGGTTYPKSPTSYPSPLPIFIPDPSLKGVSFDQLIQNRGIRFIHKVAAPCPNIVTVEDNSHDPLCPVCDGNGILYYREKEIFGVFYSNSLEKNFEMQGIWEIGTAVVTLPTEYADGTSAEFQTFDQLVIPDFPIRVWELKEYEIRPDAKQQLRYPIESMDYLAYVRSGVLTEMIKGTNFEIDDGKIKWIAGFEPPFDTSVDRGEVLVASYFANPVYNVLQHMRELRITQELVGGVKLPIRLPQQVLVKRDFLANPPEKDV